MGNSAKLVVFDLDGTLVDSQHGIVAAMAEAFAAQGLAAPDAKAVRQVVGLSLQDAVARLVDEEQASQVPAIAEGYKLAFVRERSRTDHHEPLFPGAREALAILGEAEYLLGIATGKGRRGLDITLERHGLKEYFVTLQTADIGPGKPDPAMLQRAMAETGIGPEATLVVGDTTFDMEMAVRAGAAAVGVDWGYHEAAALRESGALDVVQTFDSLPMLIEEFLKPSP